MLTKRFIVSEMCLLMLRCGVNQSVNMLPNDFFIHRFNILPILLSALLALTLAGTASAQSNPQAQLACPAMLQHTFLRLQDEKPQELCQYAGKVLIVVNTASFCGFTPQYEGLEALSAKYKDRGLVVLGFPSNDFSQEKGSNKEIADFCENTFNVKFPMFVKSRVSGSGANPLFKQLATVSSTPAPRTPASSKPWKACSQRNRLISHNPTEWFVPPPSPTPARLKPAFPTFHTAPEPDRHDACQSSSP